MSDDIEEIIFARVAGATGKTEQQLRDMAITVFASMLLNAMSHPASPLWSVMTMDPFTIEVNVPRRNPVEVKQT